ncbi:PREDICTED: uncharacterized protein LOC109186038 [Ipomoea nil]|uniref:uncharacterized protein LOC109186038 n=1 Tax=Ipomoea nil TaxID=35883 RepID=UPI0009019323|nr:PREDICTED: uncharacterized protein LOC109186038 [Ipomoea nil]
MLFSLTVSKGWTLRQLDIHNAFLNGHLAETVYMKQPPGYEDPMTPGHVCHLQRSLYGLKQAPRAWFKRLHDFLLSTGFQASKTDVSLLYYTARDSRVFLLVYEDDIIMMGNDAKLVTTLLQRLSTTFKIRDLGALGFFLGIETIVVDDGLLLSQRRYMTDLLGRSGMVDCKPLATPAAVTKSITPVDTPYDNPTQYWHIVGALQYLTITLPDLSYAVNRLCKFMHTSTEEHWNLVKRVLRYIKGTLDFGLQLTPSVSTAIHAYSDSDWASCPVDRKSTSGYAVYLGSNLISWLSKKQCTVTRSSTEAEYKALTDVSIEVTWVVSLLQELGLHSGQPATLWCDNLGVTYLCANPVFHARTKHVEIDYHFVRDKVASGDFLVNYVSTTDQLADIFTKPLPSPCFSALRGKLNVASLPPCA